MPGHRRFSSRLGNDHGKRSSASGEPLHVLFIGWKSRPAHCVPGPAAGGAHSTAPAHGPGWESSCSIWGPALPSQAPPLCPSTMFPLLPFQQVPSHPGLLPIPSKGLHLELRIFFASTKSVFQMRVLFLLEKDPIVPTQIVILGHVLHRIPIFLSLDTLLPWDLFL